MKQNQEINALKVTLSELMDTQEKYKKKVKEDIVQEFYEGEDGKRWLFGFALPCYLWQ